MSPKYNHFSGRKWEDMYIAAHLSKEQHRHLYTLVRAILDEDRSVSHWTYNVLRGLFIEKVYKRLYLKEQPRCVIVFQ